MSKFKISVTDLSGRKITVLELDRFQVRIFRADDDAALIDLVTWTDIPVLGSTGISLQMGSQIDAADNPENILLLVPFPEQTP